MTTSKKDYNTLHEISRKVHILSGISQLLDWDQETYMPEGGGSIRAEQQKTLAGIIHREKTGKKFAAALGKLIAIKTGTLSSSGKKLSEEQQAALKLWRRDYVKDTALPSSFVEEFAKLTAQTIHVWRSAKERNQFLQFAPFLDRIIGMSRKKADLIGYKEHPYDVLLDTYEPGITTREIAKLFTALQKPIVALVKKAAASAPADDSFLHGKFSTAKQLTFSKKILKAMGIDSSCGRVDLSSHPFSSTFHPKDSRITTRIHRTNIFSNIATILHEGGHSLYDTGLPLEHYGSPLGESLSLGMHESQSRWWETRIGHSLPFWQHWLPLLKQEFRGKFDAITPQAFYAAINKVSPSFIRVEADEVTYTLHVILRFELEKALIEGSLNVRDLPDAWNEKMKELLGITPPDNAHGCLQDIHWAMGGFGYFPTYTLGNLYMAHLFAEFEKTHPDWESRVAKGELSFINAWLSDEVWRHGRRYSSKELMEGATGIPFTQDAYLAYLKRKYGALMHK